MIISLYPEKSDFKVLLPEYQELGKMINGFIQYVESYWKT